MNGGTVYLGFPGDQPPYYVYEAVQIFNDCGAFPEFVPNSSDIWLEQDGHRIEIPHFDASSKNMEHKLRKREIYKAMSHFTGYQSPWGCMTGVRPAKIVNELFGTGLTPEETVRHIEEFYFARPEKAQLAVDTALNQEKFLLKQREFPKTAGIYVGIPFCPSRCLYCSFTSNPIEKYKKLVGLYLALLEKELAAVMPAIAGSGFSIESLYIGGGTPTSLNEEQFRSFMEMLNRYIAPSALKEFSLEAGRPDSITADKLKAAKHAGVTRISVNPQTMNNRTLELIGRRHTAEDIERAFWLARDESFDHINMDIIAGLPGENADDFAYTLDKISDFRPDALTVHTLSVKRAADLKRDTRALLLRSDVTGKMLLMAQKSALKMDMIPYYMYRQKNMLGNHENVSYCRSGCESPYNIHIMEEDQSIFAFGAGGVSKTSVLSPEGVRTIERAFNVKSVEDYIARSAEMAERKLHLLTIVP